MAAAYFFNGLQQPYFNYSTFLFGISGGILFECLQIDFSAAEERNLVDFDKVFGFGNPEVGKIAGTEFFNHFVGI